MKRLNDETGVNLSQMSVDGVLAEVPQVAEYLATRCWDDGSERTTSTLLFFVDGGAFKVCLNDRANARSLWASGRSLEGALACLEAMLGSGGAEWRRSAGAGQRSRGEKPPF